MPASGSHLKKPVSPVDTAIITDALEDYRRAMNRYKSAVLEAVETASVREVAKVADVSANTVQRWKKDASDAGNE